MGAKGARVQAVTGQFEVGIKFPDRNPNAEHAEGKDWDMTTVIHGVMY